MINAQNIFNLPYITKHYQMFTVSLMLIYIRIAQPDCEVFKLCFLHDSCSKWSQPMTNSPLTDYFAIVQICSVSMIVVESVFNEDET
jgi:hypothetical protein